jgi:tetratricopeptide (TPR) repeat protein
MITAETNAAGVIALSSEGGSGAVAQLRKDMAIVRKFAPDLPELAIADIYLLRPTDYGPALDMLSKAIAKSPENPLLHAERSGWLMRVGRLGESVAAAQRAADLDPLSPQTTANLVMTLAYANQIDQAREQLARMERLWAGTGALRDAQWGFHLRYGDPRLAKRYAGFNAPFLTAYLNARVDPSPANVAELLQLVSVPEASSNEGYFGFTIQALAEIKKVDEQFALATRAPSGMVAQNSYLLFRPAFAEFRGDPRFMRLAKRIQLTDYWRSTGKWPDFCEEPGLPYDCKAEAAKLGA